MQILPISSERSDSGVTEAEPVRARFRRFARPDYLFVMVVVMPVAAAILYFGFVASPVYVSESQFVVRAPDKAATTGVGVILQTAGFITANEEIFAAQSYATSRDALRAVNRNDAFERAYTRPHISVVNRFNPFGLGGSFEDLYRYSQRKIALQTDTAKSISTLTVRAYDPSDAHRFNQQLLELSEATVNRLNERGRQDLIRFAEAEVDQAKARASQAALALAAYRNRSGIVDPEKQAEAQMQMVSKLQDSVISARTELAQLQALAPQNPRIPIIRTQIGSLEREIDRELGKIAGDRRSLAAAAVQFERLTLESEFAGRQLTGALASLEEAQNEARRKQVYVERIVEPNLPDAAIEPRRLRGIIAALILSLLVYGILRMLLAGVREHAQ